MIRHKDYFKKNNMITSQYKFIKKTQYKFIKKIIDKLSENE